MSKQETIWVEPTKEPVPYPSSGGGRLKFIKAPVELPKSILGIPYWQERLVKELKIRKAPAKAPPKSKPKNPNKGDKE